MTLLLTKVLAAGLALADAFLAQWVTVGSSYSYSVNGCFNVVGIDANVNTCGNIFIAKLVDVVEMLVYFAPDLLTGIFAT